MAQGQNKLVGTLYLDLTRLKQDVAQTNALLKSIGAGIDLNLSDVVEKQVRSMLARFKSEIQNASTQTAQSGRQMADGLRAAATEIESLLTATQKLGRDGALTETRKGYDALGRSITEVYKNGQLLHKTVSENSALSKDIQYANQLYQEQADALKKIYALKTQRLKTQDGTPAAMDLDSQIADTGRLIDANNQLIALLDQQAVSRSRLARLSAEEAALGAKYAAAQAAQREKISAAEEAAARQAASGVNELQKVQQAYKQLTNSYRQYNAAVKNGNQAGQAYWSQSAQAALDEIASVEQKIGSLTMEENVRKRVLDLIEQARNAEATHQKLLNSINDGASKLDATLGRVGNRLLQMASTMILLRGLSALWKNATDFAQQYYDKQNEIRIVTGKSQAEVSRLGQQYRTLAKNMSVSATEIATAAVEFWRQGLSEDEVDRRLVATTQYAKISAMEFDEAAELITAATNTMEISAQRVVDVFAYLGDASASGPDEIGIAMQKASASAMEFGLSFEWLGAYIATISEQTRLAPEVIGTSINSIMARLHSIKQKGFSEEDETRINDVAKALGTIDVALLDSEGNWRDMSDIFDDVAQKWDTLDAKQQSYISTTMAGTRQQNSFLALMNDMAKGVEGGSRAYELYAGALAAAGTASQKYAIWQESVTAAQNRLTASLQSLYALLDAEWMKGFYEGMAGIVEAFVAGTEAMDGWNVKLPQIAAGVAGLIAVVYKLSAAFQTVRAALNAGGGLLSALSGGTLGAILAAVGAAASVITLITGGIAQAAEPVDYSERISTLTGHRDEVAELAAEYEELANTTGRTEAESARMNAILEQLSGSSMALHDALSTSTGGFVEQGEAIRDVNGYLAELEERINNLQRQEAAESFQDVSGIGDAQVALAEARENENLWREHQKFLESEAAQYTDFPTYVRGKIVEYSDVDHVQDQIYWAGLDDQLMSLVDGWFVRTDELVAALDNLGLSAQEASANAADNLDAAWQTVEDSLHVFIEGPKTTAMPDYFRDVLEGYFDQSMAGIDREAEVTSEQLTAIAADLKAKQEELYAFMQDNPRLHGLLNQYEEELQSAEPDLEAANALIEQINEILASYNALREAGEEPLPLLPELTAEGLQEIRAEAEAAVEALDTTDIYKGLAMAKEEANGFASVLSRLGEGEGQLNNLHDAVMETARAMAEGLGITDEAEIVKIGEELLEGLYDTYPGIADYVDTATGILLEGWEEGIAEAANPWTELFEAAKLEDALKAAKRDMAALEDSSLWAELLAPEGRGLYQYAEDWARALIPDGTMEEVQAQAQAFVEAFFAMFADIDTGIMDADGRIAAGMEGIVATMRQAAHDAQAEASKLETAYRSIHAGSIAREEAAKGLQSMMEQARKGDTKNVRDIFEGLSAQAVDAITAAMPQLIDKLMEGTYAAEDFETALIKLEEAETEAGKDAWQDYFSGTADGLREQSALWGEAMRGVIAEVMAADDRAGAFYRALMRLSDEGLDVSGLLEQYGALAVALLDGSANAEELYASLARLGELEALQIDLEQADALSGAAKSIDPANESYDPLAAQDAYALLEAEYQELTQLQRGSAEYIERAKQLTQEQTAAVYDQAAAYGVVSQLQVQSARAAAEGQQERKFDGVEKNSYAGGVNFLTDAVRQAEENGQDVAQAWNDALAELDEAGHLEAMAAMFGDISNLAEACGGDVAKIVEELYAMREAAQEISLSDMAQSLREEREGNFAGTDSYQGQVESLAAAFGEGGLEGVLAAMEIWNGFDESLQQSIAETYPSQVIALDEANREAQALSEGMEALEESQEDVDSASKAAGKRIEALGKELDGAQKSANSRYFKQTARAIEDLKDGAISVAEAFGEYNDEADAAIEANEQYQKASKKIASGTKVTVDEIDVLAEYLGNIDPSVLLANWDMVGPMMASALAEGEAAFNRLNEAAFIVITGTSVADFSALTSGLISVQNLAADAVQALIATSQWTLETITLPQEGAQWDPISGTWTISRMNTGQNVLRYTGSNPLRTGGSGRRSSGGGGGGGGGGGSSNVTVSKSIQKALDRMDEEQGIEDHRRRMAQLAQDYHEARGEIQGVILYLEKEMDIVRDNNVSLRQYIDTLDEQIQKKQAELAKQKEGSKGYQQAMADLEALQAAHQEYSEQLQENVTDLETLQQEIDEWHDAIREMEIDLRETIHEAILDREELNRRMLEGRIDLENELLDVLTRRYERERDELLEVAGLKRETLSEELELLDEQLEARRKLNEEEDRAGKLEELEEQLERISADPTRKKEELALREEIAELREEIAWDLAESEVDAQKKSIESQIESVDDYMEYVENYYEELLSNPRRLIEEIQDLLTKTDSEILAWLEQNHEDYQTATDATREEMRLGWQEMLDDMRGNTQTYWDEVEQIIAQGNEAIIEFLKQHSADYKEAGKLQAEAYVDEWTKKLEDLKNAYKKVSDEIKSYNYTPTSSSKSSGSGGGSSSGSKSSGTSSKTTPRFVASGTGYAEAYRGKITSVTYNGETYIKGHNSNYWYRQSDAKRIDGGRTYYWKTGTTKYVKKYLEGGLADATGLAWLDGTKQRPERILSPYQTELFEDMVKSLHAIRTLRAPASVVTPALPEARQAQGVTIENITVQVQRLESEQDYEEMAERVGEEIMEKITRGMAVGGVRIG